MAFSDTKNIDFRSGDAFRGRAPILLVARLLRCIGCHAFPAGVAPSLQSIFISFIHTKIGLCPSLLLQRYFQIPTQFQKSLQYACISKFRLFYLLFLAFSNCSTFDGSELSEDCSPFFCIACGIEEMEAQPKRRSVMSMKNNRIAANRSHC